MQSAKGFYDWEENAQCFGNMNMHFGSTRYCFMGHRLKYGRAESFPEARLAKTAYFFKEMGIVLVMRGSSWSSNFHQNKTSWKEEKKKESSKCYGEKMITLRKMDDLQ
ncbi:hypothetical protein CDAR_373501 [Caerostris darwini]|uniref:Uncharacterized protein n=1 Tax=Caerostris darwini TaxID=1538125 RepID=A0AAV4QHZ0_9ARAC|nr:hypothetical protein CDAR_373501 [Caerostris darwini]